MSNHQDASDDVRLFGADPSNTVVSNPGIGDLVVTKSGESILFTPRDAQGNALPISSIRSSDDVQVLQVVGVTQASTCTLTFDGTTTAPIPLQPIPSLTSFVWRATLPSSGSYDIGFTWGNFYGYPPGGFISSQTLVQVFGSGQLLGSATLDQSQLPSGPPDIVDAGVGVFRRVGTFDFAGTDLEVQISGATGVGMLLAGTVRVAPTGSTDAGKVGYINPDPYRPGGSDGALEGAASTASYGTWTAVSFFYADGSYHGGFYGMPTGTAATGLPAAADVEKALSALANVTAGSLQVTSPTNQSVVVQFTGPMGDQAWPTLTCSEPAIQVIHDGTQGSSVGGDFPAVTINGTSHRLGASSFAPGKTQMAFHLIQDAPALQVQAYGAGLFQANGYFTEQDGIGVNGHVGYATSSGQLATWQFQGLAGPAEFQVDVTWPGADPAGDILECVVLDGSNAVLATVAGIDQSLAPADSVDANGVGWKSLGRFTLPARVNALAVQAQGPGNAGKHVILDAVRLTRVSTDQGVQVQPGDVVLFSMPADFVVTGSGPVAAASGVPVAPAPATRLPSIPQVPKLLKLGYNCDYPIYWGNDSCFANMAIQAAQPFGLAQDAGGNPTRLALDPSFGCGATATLLSLPPGDANGLGFGVPTAGPGVWVVQYNGSPDSSCSLGTQAASTQVSEIVARRTTDGQVNRRYFQVTTTTPASPGLRLLFLGTQQNADGTYGCDVTNLAVYPPDVDPDSPSRWRPEFLQKLRGVQCFRFMEMMGTNVMNLADYAHFPSQANFPMGYAGRSIAIPIASIGPPTADVFAENVAGPVVRVTTKVPHGLTTGFIVGLRTTDGSSLGQVASNTIDATGATTTTTRAAVDPTDNYQGAAIQNMCHVIDETTLQIGIQCWSGPTARMTNTLTPANGIVYAQVASQTLMAPADMVDLCLESGLDAWINVPWLATDDCVTQLAQALCAGLPAGRLVHVEYGNEPWNYVFPGCGYSIQMSKLEGATDNSYVSHYTMRMGQVHQIFRDVWTGQGRNPAEVRRVCGVQQENSATTQACLTYALANGITFDEVAPASYYSNSPASGPLDDLLTREQLLDLFAMNLGQSDIPADMAAHYQVFRDALAQDPAQAWLGEVVVVNYEGGPDVMTTSTMTANLAARNHGVHRHPDFCEIQLNFLQMLEDAGVKLFNIFTLNGTRSTDQWGVYEGYQMVAGTGDATVDVANVDDFENLPAIKSETAAALMKWSAMIQQPPQPTRPVLRNGPTLAYGGAAY